MTVQHETSSHTNHPAVKSEPNSISPHELENTTLSEKKMDTDNKTVAKVSKNQSEPPTTTNQTTATDVPPRQNTLPAGYLLIFPKSEPGNTGAHNLPYRNKTKAFMLVYELYCLVKLKNVR